MKDIKDYLEQTNTVLLTKEAFEWLKERASVVEAEEEQEPCEDCISRADAISLFKDDVAAVNELKCLVSVHPTEKIGKWVREKKHHKDDFQEFDYWDVRCSECGARKRIGWADVLYCPMCGAKMEGGVV
jgi:hypothetical protein